MGIQQTHIDTLIEWLRGFDQKAVVITHGLFVIEKQTTYEFGISTPPHPEQFIHGTENNMKPPKNPAGYTIDEVIAIIGQDQAKAFSSFMMGQTVAFEENTNKTLFYPIDVEKFVLKLPVTD